MPHLLINPYKVGPPVAGGDFYGRSELLGRVYQALQQSNVVLLQGQRRIGKTSFLKHLAHYVGTLPVPPRAVALVPVLFDIQRYVQDTLPQFQMHLAEAMRAALVSFTPDRPLDLTVPPLSEWSADHTLFRDRWLPLVYEQLGERAIVFLVDEFDNLEGQAATQAMQTLIPFLDQLVKSEIQLKWVFSSGRLAEKLPIQYDAIARACKQIRISFLSKAEIQEVLEKPANGILRYQPNAIERVYQLTNGHPYLTQALGCEIFRAVVMEEERSVATSTDVEAAVASTLQTYGGAIASIVRVPPLEERILIAVAQLTEHSSSTNRKQIVELLLANGLQLNRDELTNSLDSLTQWELLVEDQQTLSVTVELLRTWLVKNLLVAPNQEQSLRKLAQNQFEIAERLRQTDRRDLAIKHYLDALSYVPNHLEALQGLAKVYQLERNLVDLVSTLKKLYKFDSTVLPDLVSAIEAYAEEATSKNELSVAIEQYRELNKLQEYPWQDRFVRTILEEYEHKTEELLTKKGVKLNCDAINSNTPLKSSNFRSSLKPTVRFNAKINREIQILISEIDLISSNIIQALFEALDSLQNKKEVKKILEEALLRSLEILKGSDPKELHRQLTIYLKLNDPRLRQLLDEILILNFVNYLNLKIVEAIEMARKALKFAFFASLIAFLLFAIVIFFAMLRSPPIPTEFYFSSPVIILLLCFLAFSLVSGLLLLLSLLYTLLFSLYSVVIFFAPSLSRNLKLRILKESYKLR